MNNYTDVVKERRLTTISVRCCTTIMVLISIQSLRLSTRVFPLQNGLRNYSTRRVLSIQDDQGVKNSTNKGKNEETFDLFQNIDDQGAKILTFEGNGEKSDSSQDDQAAEILTVEGNEKASDPSQSIDDQGAMDLTVEGNGEKSDPSRSIDDHRAMDSTAERNEPSQSIDDQGAMDSAVEGDGEEKYEPNQKVDEQGAMKSTVVDSTVERDYEEKSEPRQSILEYVQAASMPNVKPGHLVLFQWDSLGNLDYNRMNKTLENVQHTLMKMHLNEEHLEKFSHTKPSPHGTVAILQNSDYLLLDYSIRPPVPVITYSLNLNVMTKPDDQFYLFPTPYDVSGWNRWCIKNADCEFDENRTNLSIDQREKNRMFWRGTVHNQEREASRVIAVEMGANKTNEHWLDAAEVKVGFGSGDEMSMCEISQYKYQLDIPGWSGTTWGAIRWKMCTGSLVFKVDTWAKDWWHDTIEPWKHYVPVKQDLSDLHDHWHWAEKHPEEASAIARQGKERCLETADEEVVQKFALNVVNSLPPASEEQAAEVTALLEGVDGPNLFISQMDPTETTN